MLNELIFVYINYFGIQLSPSTTSESGRNLGWNDLPCFGVLASWHLGILTRVRIAIYPLHVVSFNPITGFQPPTQGGGHII